MGKLLSKALFILIQYLKLLQIYRKLSGCASSSLLFCLILPLSVAMSCICRWGKCQFRMFVFGGNERFAYDIGGSEKEIPLVAAKVEQRGERLEIMLT